MGGDGESSSDDMEEVEVIEDEGQFDGADDMDVVRNLVDGAGDDRVVVVALGDLEMESSFFFVFFQQVPA